ncbi:hypothetical protein DPMN_184849 [Dreissena polymorpha]|uniref:Sushi domain-containing protein n=1 Tax=Dreissena polymorpha TaxID=45954 RepID=A0A9D4DJB0_DREPO|nr:hypothetical protein DPMN_184849 [Dreissena polymorpha]
MEKQSSLIDTAVITLLVLTLILNSVKGVDIRTLKIGHCFHSDAVKVIQQTTIQACEAACGELSICKSVSFLQQISACFLRVNYYKEDETPDTPQRCFNFNRTATKDTTANIEETFCFAETNISNAKFYSALPASVGHKNSLCCDEGFTGYGQSSLTCQPNGSFTPTDFRCLKNCPYPPKETKTTKLLSWSPYRFVENTTALYQCNEGFYNLTLPQIVCDTNGKWSEYECLPACDYNKAPQIAGGYIVQKKSQWYTVNDTTQYTCNDGYYLSPGSPNITCDLQGHWVVPNISCYRYCTQETVPHVVNSDVKPGGNYTYTMTAEYQCRAGYYFGNTHQDVECKTDGDWRETKALCYQHCTTAPPENGYLKVSLHIIFVFIEINQKYLFNSQRKVG